MLTLLAKGKLKILFATCGNWNGSKVELREVAISRMVFEEVFVDFLGKVLNFVFVGNTNEFGLFGMVLHMAVMSENYLEGSIHFVLFDIGDKFLLNELFEEVVLGFVIEVTGEPEHVESGRAIGPGMSVQVVELGDSCSHLLSKIGLLLLSLL